MRQIIDPERTDLTNFRITAVVLLIAGALGCVSLLQKNVHSQEDSGSLKVGVVDIRKVYKSYERAEEFRSKIKEKKSKAEKKIQKLTDELKQIEEELKDLEPLSELWKKRAKKFYKLKSERKMKQNIWKQDTQKLLSKTSTKIYENIRKVIEKYGEENGYDLILKVNKSSIGSSDVTDINQQIATRSVLHFTNQMDLTEKITTILNKQYDEQKKNSEGKKNESGEKSGSSSG